MFRWFRRRSEPQPPGELQRYKKAVEDHQSHPVVRRWFHQITPCKLAIPGSGVAEFMMIEFRDGRLGAMVWSDGDGNWGAGGWLPLSADDLLPIDVGYLQDAPASPTFAGVLDAVSARRREAPGA
ncbi:hypothetical protein [Paludisphaera mucosa]|uniref:Uncharacterized protein n=1 Tax=Paludisphaera mucosa TaxID=3030827 RepID=A0ABT6FLS5_9BACT|nr:hypothetical protein [Paludisphaera mucosa]MDG3008484.1 hypothetical protein [Paludisphaera mucosa]